jgi:ketosteroid isomerase-like protein
VRRWPMMMAGCAFLWVVSASGVAQTTLRPEEESRIRSLENAWNQAVQSQDAKAIEPLLAGDLIYIDYDGTVMNKAQYLASIKTTTAHADLLSDESVQVHLYGRSAIVVGVYNEKGVKSGKPYALRERFADTWINRNGVWLCVASESTLMAH